MSENVKLQVFLKAVDQATRPFKHIETASKALSGEIRGTQKTLRELNAQAGKIDGFRKASAQLAVTGQSLQKAKMEAEALATQFRKNTKERYHQCTNINCSCTFVTMETVERFIVTPAKIDFAPPHPATNGQQQLWR